MRRIHRRAVIGGGLALAALGPGSARADGVLGGRWRAPPDFDRLDPRGSLGVGVRPGRTGGVRIEVERLGPAWVVHDTGHGGAGFTLAWGCAERVVAHLSALSPHGTPGPVAVIGAGVVGLTAAVAVLQRWPDARVAVYAAEIEPARTTSWVAAGLLDPAPVAEAFGPDRQAELDGLTRASLARMRALPERFGVLRRDRFVVDGRGAPLPFAGSTARGTLSDVWIADPTRLLPALVGELRDRGVPFVARSFADRADLAGLPERLIVNCTGLGTRELFGDPLVVPIRGHVVRLARTHPDQDWVVGSAGPGPSPSWVACRTDDVVVGGTWIVGDERTDPASEDRRAAADVLRRAERLFA